MERKVGTVSRGIRCPIIREGDNLAKIVTEKQQCIESAHQPNGNGSFVKLLLAHQQADKGVKYSSCNRQKDLAPRIGAFPTEHDNAGHCRADHTKGDQPGHNVFQTDIKMCFLFHSDFIITKQGLLGNKKFSAPAKSYADKMQRNPCNFGFF